MRTFSVFFFLSIASVIIASPRGSVLGIHHAPVIDDGIIGGNPADCELTSDHIFILGYRAPYAGLGEAINIGNAGYLHRFRGFSSSISWSILRSDIYSLSDIGLGFSKSLNAFAIGGRARFFFDSYRREGFQFSDGDVFEDPVFDDGYYKTAVTGDFGVALSLMESARIGIGVFNLLDPDLALAKNSHSALGRSFFVDFSYFLKSYGTIFTQIVFDPSAPDDSEIEYSIGFETMPFGNALSIRVGVDSRAFAVGAGFDFGGTVPIRLDYAFDYHFSSIGKISTGHSFAIIGRIEPKKALPDLSVNITLDEYSYPVDGIGTITITVESKIFKTRDVSVELLLQSEIVEHLHFDEIDPGIPQIIRLPFVFEKEGEFSLTATVDPSDEISEYNENNNTTTTSVRVIAPPKLSISSSPQTLEIAEAKYINQDEAVVPIIFFDHGSSEIDQRFSQLIELMAERLTQNPDAKLIIDGFYDPSSETDKPELAEDRANSIITAILEVEPGISSRLIIGDEPRDRQRIPRQSQYAEYQRFVDQENRRAELHVDIPEFAYEFKTAVFNKTDAEQVANSALSILRANPMTMLIVRVSEQEISQIEAISHSLRIKSMLINALPEYYHERVLAGSDDEIPLGMGIVFLTGEAIAFHPREIHSALSYEPSDPPDCKISYSIDSEVEITEWSLELEDSRTKKGITLSSGRSATKSVFGWDWKDDQGGLIPFGRGFKPCIRAMDELDQVSELCGEEIIAQITSREERTDKLLLVQFMFDAPSPQTRYLRDRLEWVARHIVKRASSENTTISAEIQGHTDQIGGRRRNLELSKQRAESVEERLLAYIAGLIGAENDEELRSWMSEHNVSITSEGYAETEPYSVALWRDSALSEVKIGDNELPEGRAINRRVLIVINEVRGGYSDE